LKLLRPAATKPGRDPPRAAKAARPPHHGALSDHRKQPPYKQNLPGLAWRGVAIAADLPGIVAKYTACRRGAEGTVAAKN